MAIHKTMRGLDIDMSKLMASNSNAVALGNANMNARGDIIGNNGKVEIYREDLAREYHDKSKKAVKQASLRSISSEIAKELPVYQSPAEAMEIYKQERKIPRKIVDKNVDGEI
jgi:predicted secreted protein